MKSAVIYARYSSDNQSEQSIEGQLRVCNEYAKTHDITVVKTYIDRAMTGTNDNRPDFQKMIKDSNRKEWELVLVYKLDRFSRNKYEMAVHKKTLKDNGVKVISATEYIPDSPEAIILESMLEGYAEYYSAELSQKQCGTVAESKTRYERNKAQRQFYGRYDNIRLQGGKSQGNNRRRKSRSRKIHIRAVRYGSIRQRHYFGFNGKRRI